MIGGHGHIFHLELYVRNPVPAIDMRREGDIDRRARKNIDKMTLVEPYGIV